MAGDILQKFGTHSQALTIGIASLADAAGSQSDAVDNSSDNFTQVLLMLKIKSGGSGTSASGFVLIYAYGSVDNGSSYSGSATGSSGSITVANMILIGRMDIIANATTYESPLLNVSAAFNGVMPAKWGIAIVNRTGATLDATGGNHAALWQGIGGRYT